MRVTIRETISDHTIDGVDARVENKRTLNVEKTKQEHRETADMLESKREDQDIVVLPSSPDRRYCVHACRHPLRHLGAMWLHGRISQDGC